MIENVLKTYSLEQLLDIMYTEEDVRRWMSHSHKGDFAKAVKGDGNCPADPKNLTEEELERARGYFIKLCCQKMGEAPAPA